MKKLLVSTLLLSVFALSGCTLMPSLPSSEDPSSSEPSSDPTNEIFEVKFDSKGGSEVQTQYIKYGNKVIRPEDPILESHKFTGWYYLGESWDFNVDIVKNDITLYATWSHSPNIEPNEPSEPSSEVSSSSEKPIGTKEVTVWAPLDEHTVITSIVDEYNLTADRTFDLTLYNFPENVAGIELLKDPTQEGAADLFLTAEDLIFNLQRNNIVLEIRGNYKTEILDNHHESSVKAAFYDDKLYGFPVTIENGYFLWYNKAALSEYQADSLETILKVAKETGKQVLMDVDNGWYANSFLMSPDACGTESLRWKTVDGRVYYETNWDNEVGVKVSSYINSLLQPYYEDGTLVDSFDNDDICEGFRNDTMIAAVSGSWIEAELLDIVGEKLGAKKLPTYTIDDVDYQMASFMCSKVYCVNRLSNVEKQKNAVELARLLTSKEAQLLRFETRGKTPSNIEASQDSRYTEYVSLGEFALFNQNIAAGCVQSLTAEGRYWDVGKAIGEAYLDGNLGDCANWQEFLTMQMDILRRAV